MSTISDLQARAYQQSADKGFHDDEPTQGRELSMLNAERIALMHSELSEALEELRKGKGPNETWYAVTPRRTRAWRWLTGAPKPLPKPEDVPSELADVVIRVLDFCGATDIDLEAMILEKLDYNATRGHKHGGKAF